MEHYTNAEYARFSKENKEEDDEIDIAIEAEIDGELGLQKLTSFDQQTNYEYGQPAERMVKQDPELEAAALYFRHSTHHQHKEQWRQNDQLCRHNDHQESPCSFMSAPHST
jgi:hypothetical protein